MGKADLHSHTRHTSWGDGNQSVEELFRYVQEETDLDVFGITDHDNADAARAGWLVHQRGNYRFGFLPGVEVTNMGGHLLCYFPSGKVVDIPSLRPFWWTVRYAQAQGAICVAAHPVFPAWSFWTIDRGLAHGLHLDGLEVVNASISEEAQARLEKVSKRFTSKLAFLGNSDAHEQMAIGSGYTSFPGRTTDDLVQALRSFATQPVFVRRQEMDPRSRAFTTRRSMTRPGWVHNIWREIAG